MRVLQPADGVRVVVNAPAVAAFDPRMPTRIVFYATPNGNTIEQTLGCRANPGLDWHFDIQHVAAQIRPSSRARARGESRAGLRGGRGPQLARVALAPRRRRRRRSGRSWPRSPPRSRARRSASRCPATAVAAASSGASSTEVAEIPDAVDRIIFLDANYSYDDGKGHGDEAASPGCGDHRATTWW